MRKQAFTLVELLVVIGIIALLISILLPALNKAREAANEVTCASNMRQLGQHFHLYVNEHKGALPPGYWRTSGTAPNVVTVYPGNGFKWYIYFVSKYFKGVGVPQGTPAEFATWIRKNDPSRNIYTCPSDQKAMNFVDFSNFAINNVGGGMSYMGNGNVLPDGGSNKITKFKAGAEVMLLTEKNATQSTGDGNAITAFSSRADRMGDGHTGVSGTGQWARHQRLKTYNVLHLDGHVEPVQYSFIRYGSPAGTGANTPFRRFWAEP